VRHQHVLEEQEFTLDPGDGHLSLVVTPGDLLGRGVVALDERDRAAF